jgi:lipopolysaccharide transport system permease protein
MSVCVSSLINPFRRWWSYRDLVRNLVSKEIKVRYQGAALGFAWSLMNPLMITLMYLVVFTYVFRSNLPHYPLFMVVGIIHWNLFSMLVMQSSELLVGNADLLKKIYFPRLLVPFSNLLVNATLWLMALGVLLVLYKPLGGVWHWGLLLYPFYLLMFLGFTFGVMLVLSVLYIDFRDIKHLVEVFIQLLFWGTPIIYPITRIPYPIVQELMKLSPFAEFSLIFQDIFWRNVVPSWQITLAFSGWTCLALAIGLGLFYRRGAKLIERL